MTKIKVKNPEYDVLPLNGHILIEKEEVESKTASGLLLPENAKEAPNTATVIAISKSRVLCDKADCACECEVEGATEPGDKVVYKQWGATPIKVNGKELFFVKESELLAILKPKKK